MKLHRPRWTWRKPPARPPEPKAPDPAPGQAPKHAAKPDHHPSRSASTAMALVAMLGGVFSYQSMFERVKTVFHPFTLPNGFQVQIAWAFPLMVDLGIGAATWCYLDTVRKDHPVAGWRIFAHAGIATTLGLNILAADPLHHPENIPWHLAGPACWAAFVELRTKEARKDREAKTGKTRAARIPIRLWLTPPLIGLCQTGALWVWMARFGIDSHTEARTHRGQYRAAVDLLKMLFPTDSAAANRKRQIITRQLRDGTLDPVTLITVTGLDEETGPANPDRVLRAALTAALGVKPKAKTKTVTEQRDKPTPPKPTPAPTPKPQTPVRQSADGPTAVLTSDKLVKGYAAFCACLDDNLSLEEKTQKQQIVARVAEAMGYELLRTGRPVDSGRIYATGNLERYTALHATGYRPTDPVDEELKELVGP